MTVKPLQIRTRCPRELIDVFENDCTAEKHFSSSPILYSQTRAGTYFCCCFIQKVCSIRSSAHYAYGWWTIFVLLRYLLTLHCFVFCLLDRIVCLNVCGVRVVEACGVCGGSQTRCKEKKVPLGARFVFLIFMEASPSPSLPFHTTPNSPVLGLL